MHILEGKLSGEKAVNSDEDVTTVQDDGTDTEQHESLPEDKVSIIEAKAAQSSMQKSANASKSLLMKNPKTSSPIPLSPEAILKAKRGSSKTSKKKLSCLEQSSSRSTSSGEKRRDSAAPSEGIPVITISKTESSESILQDAKSKHNVKNDNDAATSSHKPKIKYMLKKQDANVDIDSISFI